MASNIAPIQASPGVKRPNMSSRACIPKKRVSCVSVPGRTGLLTRMTRAFSRCGCYQRPGHLSRLATTSTSRRNTSKLGGNTSPVLLEAYGSTLVISQRRPKTPSVQLPCNPVHPLRPAVSAELTTSMRIREAIRKGYHSAGARIASCRYQHTRGTADVSGAASKRLSGTRMCA
jgi:hypothetical protein